MASTNQVTTIYNHPSVVSNITNNDSTYISVSGNRPFYYPIISERGEDNKIKLISEVNDFLFQYGNPNLKLYGQASYNIINLLNNKESVYVMRLTPSNAGYSHAILNVQTKVIGEKKVLDVNNETILMDNVSIRPTTTYSSVNNYSKDLLEYEMKNSSKSVTVDGYKNNLLFFVIPKGRGKYYDKFGFRIYLNNSYDDTYEYRVYNFEVLSYDEYGSPSIVDGPFYVSLYPDAINASGESMFIEDIVNRYSKYVEVVFNEEAYDYITNLINPDINPSHIDILTGKTRISSSSDDTETYYCEQTRKNEDIHIKIHKYDSLGYPITDGVNIIKNIVENTDETEINVIGVDNTTRSNKFISSNSIYENMKKAVSDIYTNKYDVSLRQIGDIENTSGEVKFKTNSSINQKYEEAKTQWETTLAAIQAFTGGDMFETDFIKAYNSITLSNSKINNLLEDINYVYAYTKLLKNDASALSAYNLLNTILDAINSKEVVSIKMLSYKQVLNNFLSQLVINKTLQSIDDEIIYLKEMLSDVNGIIDYYRTYLGNEAENNTEFNKIIEEYNTSIDLINEIDSELTPEDMKREYLIDCYDKVETVLDTCIKLSNYILLINEQDIGDNLYGSGANPDSVIKALINGLATLTYAALEFYTNNYTNSSMKKEIIKQAKEVALVQQDDVNAKRNNIYTTSLIDFSYPIRLSNGSDGDLDESDTKKRSNTIDNLLIKGFKGMIDDAITSKKKCPARFVLDANYSPSVKNAINTLINEIRDDMCFYCDTGFTANPEEALNLRNTLYSYNSTKVFIYTQDFTVYDEFTGKDIKVTTPYFLAKKIPACSKTYGLHRPIAGNRRGVIDGFKSLSWIPNETYKELLYNKHINYIESDTKRTKFGSQLTSENRTTPLSNINNVITVLDIKNDVEEMAEDYIFEFNNQETIDSFQNELNDYLSSYTSSKACERINAQVFASDYDKQQKILRVSIEIKFFDIIERILISLDVVKQ